MFVGHLNIFFPLFKCPINMMYPYFYKYFLKSVNTSATFYKHILLL